MKLMTGLVLILVALLGWQFWDAQRATKSAQEAHQKLGEVSGQLDTQTKALKAANRAAQRSQELLVERNHQLALLQTKQRKTQKELDDALELNRAWADQRAPDGVLDALRPRPE